MLCNLLLNYQHLNIARVIQTAVVKPRSSKDLTFVSISPIQTGLVLTLM